MEEEKKKKSQRTKQTPMRLYNKNANIVYNGFVFNVRMKSINLCPFSFFFWFSCYY